MVPSGSVAGEGAGREAKLLQQTIVVASFLAQSRIAGIQEEDFTALSFDLGRKANDGDDLLFSSSIRLTSC